MRTQTVPRGSSTSSRCVRYRRSSSVEKDSSHGRPTPRLISQIISTISSRSSRSVDAMGWAGEISVEAGAIAVACMGVRAPSGPVWIDERRRPFEAEVIGVCRFGGGVDNRTAAAPVRRSTRRHHRISGVDRRVTTMRRGEASGASFLRRESGPCGGEASTRRRRGVSLATGTGSGIDLKPRIETEPITAIARWAGVRPRLAHREASSAILSPNRVRADEGRGQADEVPTIDLATTSSDQGRSSARPSRLVSNPAVRRASRCRACLGRGGRLGRKPSSSAPHGARDRDGASRVELQRQP